MQIRTTHWQPVGDPGPRAGRDELAALAGLLAHRRIVAITGAGISTDSGIPDYRGPDSPARSPMTYQQFVGDPDFRRHYWARNHVGWQHMNNTVPNAGHRALAELERRGSVIGVITQNVDLLHERAGSRRVVDLHGTYATVRCLSCGRTMTRADLDEQLTALNPGFREEIGHLELAEIAPDADAEITRTEHFLVVDCPWCGGMLKPDIVYFGESVPAERVAEAAGLVAGADAVLVAGSSLAVMSGLRLVRQASREGKPIAIVTRGVTRGDDLATLKVNIGTSEALTYLADAI